MLAIFKSEFMQRNIRAYIMLISLAAIVILFSLLTEGTFISPRNISMLTRQTTVVGIAALGMMFIIVAGHIDLSVGSLLGLCGTIAAVLQVWHGWETIPTIIAVMIVGMLLGTWQGYWVSYRNVPAFIVTLGGLLMFRGIKLGVSKSMAIAPMNPSFSVLGQGYVTATVGYVIAFTAIALFIAFIIFHRRSKKKSQLNHHPLKKDAIKVVVISFLIITGTMVLNMYQGIPLPVLIMLILSLVFSFIASNTVFGRTIYAIGGNFEATRLAGINTKKITLLIFVIMGALAALAGIILTARLNAATVAAGDTMELSVIAACIIGGTSMSGGVGRISGVIIGALIMASLDNGMSLLNVENYWQFIVKGIVLIMAVWADSTIKSSYS